jgi:predicted RNase H-like HicB family nuclease
VTMRYTAAVWQEEDLFVAQCLEVDVASQGESEDDALANLVEALGLHFEHPQASRSPKLVKVEVPRGAA